MILKYSFDFIYSGNSEKVTLDPGTYLFECWGAQGYIYNSGNIGGKGSYTKGTISLKTTKTFYVFVGQFGRGSIADYSFNGGGGGQMGGGGSSDIRLVNGTWDNFESLKSRIIVAAGGSGPDSYVHGAPGGCLVGLDVGYGKGGTQTAGGFGLYNGSFGKGGFYPRTDGNGCGGGGGGYYGGGSSTNAIDYPGGGGSSFISGYPGCNAVKEESTLNNIIHSDSPIHYSGLVFTHPVMIDGKTSMPSPTPGLNETGHESNGHVRITILKGSSEYSCSQGQWPILPIFILILLVS
jgi:hypothetical protein